MSDGAPLSRLVCATTNAGKIAEIRNILGSRIELLPAP